MGGGAANKALGHGEDALTHHARQGRAEGTAAADRRAEAHRSRRALAEVLAHVAGDGVA